MPPPTSRAPELATAETALALLKSSRFSHYPPLTRLILSFSASCGPSHLQHQSLNHALTWSIYLPMARAYLLSLPTTSANLTKTLDTLLHDPTSDTSLTNCARCSKPFSVGYATPDNTRYLCTPCFDSLPTP